MQAKKNSFFFENMSAVLYRFVSLIMRCCQKEQLVKNFFDFETQFSAEIQA